jgi:hypothetical protein
LQRGAPSDLAASPALEPFVRRSPGSNSGALIWPGAKSLVAAQRFDARVELRPLSGLGKEHLNGLSLVFSGPYVSPYFAEDLRSEYHALAEALADVLNATDGALYARCEGSDAHYIGSWFLGRNAGSAVGSLVYFMAGHNDVPILKSEVLGNANDPGRRSHEFDAINQATASLDRGATATLIGRELGMISGRPDKPSRLTFPFRDANRATRASVAAARSLGLSQTQ